MKQLNPARLSENVSSRFATDLAEHNISGASALVLQNGKELLRANVGTTSPVGTTPVTDQTLFRLASMTKPITAAAAMLLVDRGRLSLETPIDQFYPAFASPLLWHANGERTSVNERITVKHLLTHTSGIASGKAWTESLARMTSTDRASVENFVAFLSGEPLSFVPGTTQEYSGVGAFSVLTGIVQKVADEDFESFLRRELFLPCQMPDTTFLPTEEQWARLMTMHAKKDGVSAVGDTHEGCVFEYFPSHNYLGGAGLISCVNDYANFATMLLAGGKFDGRRILSEASVREMSTAQLDLTVHPNRNQRWGLSVRVIVADDGILPHGAYGWSGAYGTHFWIDPENRIIAVYMKNSRHDGGSGAVTAANFEKDVYATLM